MCAIGCWGVVSLALAAVVAGAVPEAASGAVGLVVFLVLFCPPLVAGIVAEVRKQRSNGG